MPVPYLGNSLKGWIRPRKVKLITKKVVGHLVEENERSVTLWMNIQPLPRRKVDRKPSEQRTWDWWSLIVTKGPNLNTDDQVIIKNFKYVVQNGENLTDSGFRLYEVIRGYV